MTIKATQMIGAAFALAAFLGVSACANEADDAQDWREDVLNAAADILEREYIYEDKGAQLAGYLRDEHAEYSELNDKKQFARQLTLDLFELANDKHLRIVHNPESEAQGVGGGDDRPQRDYCRTAPLSYDVIGDVGIITAPRFFGDDDYTAKFDDAMIQVADTNALVLDLRGNCGGGPMLVRHISTYFFGEKTHLVSTEARGENTRERWTFDDVPGPRYLNKPLYILTNENTFSAAESFTFGMKTTGRALTVGEETGGGGHFGDMQRLSEDFEMFVPMGRTFDPRTGIGWEASGIAPDIESAADDALETAVAHFEKSRGAD